MEFGGTGLSEAQWAQIIITEAHKLGYKITPRQVAEGLGVRAAEGFSATGGHIGPWQEEAGFGSTAERLNAHASTRLALQRWKSDGESWWPAWGNWERAEAAGPGPDRWRQYIGAATRAAQAGPGQTPAAAHPGLQGQPAPSEPGEAGEQGSAGLSGDLMHFGLVGVLVLGGGAMIGLGATRMLGSARGAA